MFTLAIPVVMAELGWMTMGLVDTLMVGRIGPEAIGAVGIGSSLFMAICIFAMGLLLGLDTLVAHAFGAGRFDECHRWLAYGVTLSLLLSIPITIAILVLSSALSGWGLDPAVLRLTQPYLDVLAWSIPPLLLYASFRRYLQGMGVGASGDRGACLRQRPERVRQLAPDLRASRRAGDGGSRIRLGDGRRAHRDGRCSPCRHRVSRAIPRSISTDGCSIPRATKCFRLLDPADRSSQMRQLLALGLPAASQVTLEVGVFAAATALAGRLPPAALAAHQIAVNLASLTFMVPLGIASAGAVRVGHAVGRRDALGAARSGWTAILFGVSFMSLAAAAFLLIPRALIGAFTSDPTVVSIGVSLLFVAALFQLFDGVQAVSTGALRGLGDTRTPMLWNLAGHWFIGLPLGYTLCFALGFGVIGLWWGLSTGLIICGIALVTVWARSVRHLDWSADLVSRID